MNRPRRTSPSKFRRPIQVRSTMAIITEENEEQEVTGEVGESPLLFDSSANNHGWYATDNEGIDTQDSEENLLTPQDRVTPYEQSIYDQDTDDGEDTPVAKKPKTVLPSSSSSSSSPTLNGSPTRASGTPPTGNITPRSQQQDPLNVSLWQPVFREMMELGLPAMKHKKGASDTWKELFKYYQSHIKNFSAEKVIVRQV
jgi:hypothetical protein